MTDLKDIINLSNITGEKVAVGVSGGADSLALVLLLDEFLRPQGRRVIALTVDHGLRSESHQEAAYVAALMSEYGIEHHILIWEGEKPRSGIEEAARAARYRLLGDWCQANGVETLCVAHHQQDQAETFFMRLQRGSGLTGLCGMAPVSEVNGLRIVRPLLAVAPQQLKDYLSGRNIRWVEDPSNRSDDFLRVRIRKFLPELEKIIGITPQRIAETMQILARSRSYIQQQLAEFTERHLSRWENAGASVELPVLLNQHNEIVYQCLSMLIKEIGGQVYTPRADDVERLLAALRNESFRGATLGHCEIFVAQKKLWIVPELKLKKRLPKKVWEEFCVQNPQYAGKTLPYKLRAALVKRKMSIEF